MWGIGTTFQVKKEGESTFTDIARIRSITPPGVTADMADATVLESEGGVEEKQPTILRLGDATLNVLFEPDDEDQKAFLERLVNRELVTCRIVYPDGDNYLKFKAYIAGFEPGEITTDGLLEATITLAATAKPSFGPLDSSLSGLAIGTLTLVQDDGETEGFDPEVLDYTATTTNDTNKITATPANEDAVVVIKVNNEVVESGSSATWDDGENEVVITVTVGDEETVYTVIVTKTAG